MKIHYFFFVFCHWLEAKIISYLNEWVLGVLGTKLQMHYKIRYREFFFQIDFHFMHAYDTYIFLV